MRPARGRTKALVPGLVGGLLAASASSHDQRWVAPEAERARVNPIGATPEALAKGRALYEKHCATCHGDRGKGDGPAAPHGKEQPHDLTDAALQARVTDGEILWKLTQGLKQGEDVVMPAFVEKVPLEADRWKLVLFVRKLGPTR